MVYMKFCLKKKFFKLKIDSLSLSTFLFRSYYYTTLAAVIVIVVVNVSNILPSINHLIMNYYY